MARGRFFEDIFGRYCRYRGLRLTERAGSRTVDGQYSASRFLHESDAVLVTPDLLVHLELKYLGGPLEKNELLIFNQKGLDFLFARNTLLRDRPFYRMILSGSPLSDAARRFSANWGIITIEPGRIPLLGLYALAGQTACSGVSNAVAGEIQREIPLLIAPLQMRMRQFTNALASGAHVLTTYRIERALQFLQKDCGDKYRRCIDRDPATSLQSRYNYLKFALRL